METKLDLFDTYVGSILNYGCEIWGNHKGPDIERLHLNFMKRLLGVKRATHNMMVYRELARFPFHINRCVRLVKYWLKISSSENCIVHSVYNMLLSEYDSLPQNKYNWLRDIKTILQSVGMNNVWLLPNSINAQLLLAQIKQRLQDAFLQNLDSLLEQSSKCILYRNIVSENRCIQFYLHKALPDRFKIILAKYRMSSHQLSVEVGRYNNIERNERKCRLCTADDVEDEYHFILVCPRFSDLRKIYIHRYYYRRPSVYKLIELFQSHSLKCLCNLAKYLLQSTQVRNQLI